MRAGYRPACGLCAVALALACALPAARAADGAAASASGSTSTSTSTSTSVDTSGGIFFDDFSYAASADLATGGWTMRTADGHPGLPGGRFGVEAFALLDDPLQPGNRVLRLSARTDGSGAGTLQAQLCGQRKYLRGTYAARIRFSDAPRSGARGDPVVESFYAVAPLAHDFDPDFSEVDWEYLPNGGWGSPRQRLYGVSWQTVRLEPWEAHNAAHEEFGSFDGWHVLLMQVTRETVREFVDGRQVAAHAGRSVPVVPMAISFNLWFAIGGALPVGGAPRVYDEDIDWVFHAREAVLDPAAVDAQVRALRAARVARTDSVPAADPPLAARCDF